MSGAFIIDDRRGRRLVTAKKFPLALGGPQSDLELAGLNGGEPAAFIGLDEGEVFVQPGTGETTLAFNGAPLTASQWLSDGDVLTVGTARLEIRAQAAGVRFRVVQDAPPGKPGLAPPQPRDRASESVSVRPVAFKPSRDVATGRKKHRWRPSWVLAALGFVVLAAVATFLFTARVVDLELEPRPDRLELTGPWPRLALAGRFLLRSGSYALSAEKDGFEPLDTAFEVGREPRQSLRFALQPSPGRLAVETVDGAAIKVDGQIMGHAPLAAFALPPGEHQVEVTAERYRPLTVGVEILGSGSTTTLEAPLEPLWAVVELSSEPPGATLRIAGELRGKTPTSLELLAGSHDFALVLGGHKPYRGRVEVAAGEPSTVTARLLPADGNLVLTSKPTAASLTVDGSFRGQTPLDLVLEPGRSHRLEISKAGYDPAVREVRLASGESQELQVELDERRGEVRVAAWPEDAELFVDGESRGLAQQVLQLPAVAHEIEIRKKGYEPFRTTVHPLPAFPQVLEVSLTVSEEPTTAASGTSAKNTASPAKYTAPSAKEIVGPNGHQLRWIGPGRFRMGASRREPGRRANETLREVELRRPFYLAAQEVSNRQFRKFRKDHLSGQLGGINLEIDHHPAVRLSWQEAAAYCNWLSEQEDLEPAYVRRGGKLVAAEPMTLGYRLPSEAEWAWAARFAGGATAIKYPWGDALPIAPGSGNYADRSARGVLPGVLADYNDGFPATSPVDSFAPNALGLYNLGGNVAEWVHDVYNSRGTAEGVEQDPLGPRNGELHVIRGSSFMHSTITELRLTFRDYGDEPRPDIGFRVARYAR